MSSKIRWWSGVSYLSRFFLSILLILSARAASSDAWTSDREGSRRTSTSSTSSSTTSLNRPSYLDDILSRPALPVPVSHLATQAQTSRASSTSLSRKEVDAIYREHVRATGHNERSIQQGIRFRASDEIDDMEVSSDDSLFDDSTLDDEEEEEDEDIYEDNMIDSKFDYLANTRSSHCSSKQNEANKKVFERAWKARKLNCKLEPRDLALGVTQLRVDLIDDDDYSSSLGRLASNHIKKNTTTECWSQYRFWSRRYYHVLRNKVENIRLKEKIRGYEYPTEEKKRMLRKRIILAEPKTYDDWKKKCANPGAKEVDVLMKAKRAGDAILEIARRELHEPNLRMKDLSIAEIELYSRELDLHANVAKEYRISRQSIKRYLKRYLGKQSDDINEFSRLRSEWKLDYYYRRRQEKERRARQARALED